MVTTKRKKPKKTIKRKKDMVDVTISLPEETFYWIKQNAKDELRTIQNQARLYLEIGIEILQQQAAQEQSEQDEVPERESAIGFHMPSQEEEYDDE